jgi:hypothetical protein
VGKNALDDPPLAVHSLPSPLTGERPAAIPSEEPSERDRWRGIAAVDFWERFRHVHEVLFGSPFRERPPRPQWLAISVCHGRLTCFPATVVGQAGCFGPPFRLDLLPKLIERRGQEAGGCLEDTAAELRRGQLRLPIRIVDVLHEIPRRALHAAYRLARGLVGATANLFQHLTHKRSRLLRGRSKQDVRVAAALCPLQNPSIFQTRAQPLP